MPIPVVSTTSTTVSSSLANSQALGKDAFLKLMVAQLRNQDPLKPVENDTFVLQLSQLSSMEQLQNVSSSLNKMSDAMSLGNTINFIGKTVEYQLPNGSTTMGIVSQVNISSGKVNLLVGGNLVSTDQLINVK